jgi:hypothetical protein
MAVTWVHVQSFSNRPAGFGARPTVSSGPGGPGPANSGPEPSLAVPRAVLQPALQKRS